MDSPWLLRSGPPHVHDVEGIADLVRRHDRTHRLDEIAETVRAARHVACAFDRRSGALIGVGWVHADGFGFGHTADVFVVPHRRGEGVAHAIVRRLATPAVGESRSWLLRGAGEWPADDPDAEARALAWADPAP